jgi:hypothetical protein
MMFMVLLKSLQLRQVPMRERLWMVQLPMADLDWPFELKYRGSKALSIF